MNERACKKYKYRVVCNELSLTFVEKMVVFIMPGVIPGKPLAAVYKITFDGTCFYIGGTTDLLKRTHKWKAQMTRGIFKNFKVRDAYEKCAEVKMEIVEVVDDPRIVKKVETKYIQSSWGDPLLLNRCPSGESSIGMKWTDQQVELLKTRSLALGQKVGKYDKEGNLIETYPTIAQAIESNKLSRRDIVRVFKYNNRSAKGFMYRKIGADGVAIIPPERKKRERKKGYKWSDETRRKFLERKKTRILVLPPHTKPYGKYDLSGVEIDRYPSFSALCTHFDIDRSNLKKMLKKGRPGYYKGFFYHPIEE